MVPWERPLSLCDSVRTSLGDSTNRLSALISLLSGWKCLEMFKLHFKFGISEDNLFLERWFRHISTKPMLYLLDVICIIFIIGGFRIWHNESGKFSRSWGLVQSCCEVLWRERAPNDGTHGKQIWPRTHAVREDRVARAVLAEACHALISLCER